MHFIESGAELKEFLGSGKKKPVLVQKTASESDVNNETNDESEAGTISNELSDKCIILIWTMTAMTFQVAFQRSMERLQDSMGSHSTLVFSWSICGVFILIFVVADYLKLKSVKHSWIFIIFFVFVIGLLVSILFLSTEN